MQAPVWWLKTTCLRAVGCRLHTETSRIVRRGNSLPLKRVHLIRSTQSSERFQNFRAPRTSVKGGVYFRPTDEDLSVGTPDRKTPLGTQAP